MLDITRTIRTLAEGEGERLDVLGASMVVKSAGLDGLFLADHVVPPGYFVPPHVHEAEDEVFVMLEGRLTLLDGTGERQAGLGSVVQLPAGLPHGFRNDGAEPVRFLVLVTPGTQAAEMFRHLDRAGRAGALTPESVGAICAQYGVRMLPP